MFLNDFDRIKKLGRYLTKDKKTIYLILIVLLPVSFAGAVQPLLVGQAITILKISLEDSIDKITSLRGLLSNLRERGLAINLAVE